MKICFFGVGGVGGYFGALVTKQFENQHKIYFIARGKHKKAICANGLTLKKSGGTATINVHPALCTDSVGQLPMCDIIVLSVKSYDLDHAVSEIAKISTSKTIILTLLNGVDIYERIRKQLKSGVVLPSCVYVGTHIESPGIIYQKGGSCKILFGADPQFPTEDLSPIRALFQEASIDFEEKEDVDVAIWSKYMFIAAYGLVTAANNKTLGEVHNSAELGESTKQIMREIYAIARKQNIPLDENIVENSFTKAKEFPFEAKTSFQRDIETKGKKNEGELYGGTIIKLGKLLGISVSETEKVYNQL